MLVYVTLPPGPDVLTMKLLVGEELHQTLEKWMVPYDPQVTHAPLDVPMPDPAPRREVFLVHVTAYDEPTMEIHSPSSARRLIMRVLRHNRPQYNAVVALAPANLQEGRTQA
jgi:hypothetical protein